MFGFYLSAKAELCCEKAREEGDNFIVVISALICTCLMSCLNDIDDNSSEDSYRWDKGIKTDSYGIYR